MYSADLLAANGLGMLKCEAQNPLRGFASDELDGLDHAVDDHVLDARVFTFGVFTDQDGVDVVVGGLEACDGAAGTDVGKEVEGAAESEVERDVAFSDGSLALLVSCRLQLLTCRRTAKGPFKAT